MIRALEVDGGGSKGMIPITVLVYIEQITGKPIYELFDLMVGTSVGAIICGILSTGKVTATQLNDHMIKVLPQMFKWRIRVPFFQPKYRRQPLTNCFDEMVGLDFKMSESIVKFMCTSVSKVDGKNHYLKGWEKRDGKLKLIDVINRSYAAPMYFGHIVDKAAGQVWMDGGTGNQNCPLGNTLTETVRQGWMQKAFVGDEALHLLSLGTGYSSIGMPFKKAKRGGNVSDVLFYADPIDGGLARLMSVESQVKAAYDTAQLIEGFSFNRVDCMINKKLDKMDKVKYMSDYQSLGAAISSQVDIEKLQ